MNLEPIDTSTTAGKARVMQLAAEGRKVALMPREESVKNLVGWVDIHGDSEEWDWPNFDYAIIAQDAGVWVVKRDGGCFVYSEYRDGAVFCQTSDLSEECW